MLCGSLTLRAKGPYNSRFSSAKTARRGRFFGNRRGIISLEEAIAKADTLIEALGWIRRFRDRITVIKLGGSVMSDADALRHLLRNRPIYGLLFDGKRYDAGDKLGFLKATIEFALERKDLGGPLREYLKSLKL